MSYYKDEKRGTWYVEGRYRDPLTNELVRYKKRGFKSKDEAKKYDAKMVLTPEDKKSNIKIDDIFEELIDYSKPRKKESTYTTDEKRYKSHIQPYFGDKKISDLTTHSILKWQTQLIDKGYKPSYINSLHTTFNKIFTHANKMYGINFNPLSRVARVAEDKNSVNYLNIWTDEEFNKFYSVIESLQHKVIFRLYYTTGMRRGELLALLWSDYNGNSITINKTCSQAKGGFKITPPKTKNSVRVINLDKKTISLIEEYKKTQERLYKFDNSCYMFGYDRPIAFQTLKTYKDNYEILAGVKHIRIHDFRHSHVSYLLNKNVPLPKIAARVGDTITTITEVYAHLMDFGDSEIINYMEEI